MSIIKAARAQENDSTTPLWTSSFIFLCVANLCVFFNNQVMLPTIPLYIVHIGGNAKDAGIVMGVFMIAATMMRPVGGSLLDRYGRKKTLLAGLVVTAVATAFYHAAATLMLLILVRIMHGFSFSISSTATGTIAADILPRSRFGEGLGYFSLTNTMSMAVAPLIGLWLLDSGGYTALFGISTVIAVLAFVLSAVPAYEQAGPGCSETGKAGSSWSGIYEKGALKASFIMFFIATTSGAVTSFVALHALEKGVAGIGMFFTINALASFLTRLFVGRWIDKNGAYKIVLAGIISTGICMIIIAFSGNITGFLLAGAANGFGMGICYPALQTLAVRDVSPGRRGVATSIYFSSMDLGIGLGTIVFGWVALYTGYQTMYLSTVLSVLIAGAAFITVFKNKGVAGNSRGA